MPLHVTVAEDSALMREGIVALLERLGHTVVAAVPDAPALLAAVRRERPGLVLADVRMPPDHTDDGLRAAVALRVDDPALPVLVLSQYVEPVAAEALLDTGDGAVGYLLKDRVADVTAFAAALDQVAAGGTVLDPEVVSRLVRRRRDPVGRLSPREREVLALMAQGRANAEIATDLVLSDAAVNKHVRSVFTKLDLPADASGHRRVLAVLAWLRAGA